MEGHLLVPDMSCKYKTKTSIRYAKENDREKREIRREREREKGRRGDIEREEEIRDKRERCRGYRERE